MKKILFITIIGIILLNIDHISAQNVTITDSTGYNAHSSAMLDVCSFSKGILIPRADTANISNPAKGLLVCDTTGSEVIFYFYDGSRWIDIATSGGGTDSIWVENLTDSIVYLRNDFNKLGIGIDTPLAKLDVMGDTIFNAEDTVPLFVVRDKDGKEVFVVYPKGVFIFVDTLSGSSKATTNDQPTGFRVGKKTIGSTKDFDEEYFSVLPATVADTIDPSEARVLWYPKKEAFMAGRVLVEGVDSVGTNSWASGYESKSIGDYSQALGYQAIARGHYSTAIGYDAVADGDYSFALGDSTWAGGGGGAKGTADNCYAFGKNAEATGNGSYAFGYKASSTGQDAVAIGAFTEAIGTGSYAFGSPGRDTLGNPTGKVTSATGDYSFAIGLGSKAVNEGDFAMGIEDSASGYYSLSMGYASKAKGYLSVAIGNECRSENYSDIALGYRSVASGGGAFSVGGLATGERSTALSGGSAMGFYSVSMGWGNNSNGAHSFTMGKYDTANGYASMAFGWGSIADGELSIASGVGARTSVNAATAHAFGYDVHANGAHTFVAGKYSTAESFCAAAFGWDSHADSSESFAAGAGARAGEFAAISLGAWTLASGYASFATGLHTTSSGSLSFTSGANNLASGTTSIAMGSTNVASNECATVIGKQSTASGYISFASGYLTNASEEATTAFGVGTNASFYNATAFGYYTTARGVSSVAMGGNTIANTYRSTALRYWNDTTYCCPASHYIDYGTDPLFVIGNGSDNTHRSNAITVLKSGNTAIGTSSPASRFHVYGSDNPLVVRLETTAGFGSDKIEFWSDGGSSYNWRPASIMSIDNGSYTGGLSFLVNGTGAGNKTNETEAMRIVNNTVGINNVSSPTQTLDVNGNARIRSIGSGAYVGPVNRTSDGTFTTATSDKRLKENIKPLQNSLDKVLKLQGVTFTWKKSPEMGNKIGFIAQEVKEILPELVFTNPADGYFGINYAEMSAVLVEALKEQQKIIDRQYDIINKQAEIIKVHEQRFSEIEKEIDKIKTYSGKDFSQK